MSAGVFFSSSTGGMLESEEFYAQLNGHNGAPPSRLLLASQQVNGPGDAVARLFGVSGPVESFSSACASGAYAIGAALDAIRSGEVDLALAGGADSLCRLTYGGFNSLRSIDESPCAPFRTQRAGLSLGEGGAVLVLEPLEAALGRGAEPLAELSGAGFSCDAHHMTAPHPRGEGASAAVRQALHDADISAENIDFINAHGTGTPLNDTAEWQALSEVFGTRLPRLPLTCTKGSVGHLLGAAGVLEALATVLCLSRGEVHATPGGGEVDPDTPVDLVLEYPRRLSPLRAAVSLNLGFGGANGALVFSRWTGA